MLGRALATEWMSLVTLLEAVICTGLSFSDIKYAVSIKLAQECF